MFATMEKNILIILVVTGVYSIQIYARRKSFSAVLVDEMSSDQLVGEILTDEMAEVGDKKEVEEVEDVVTNQIARGERCQRQDICQNAKHRGTIQACQRYPGALLRCDEYLRAVREQGNVPHPAEIMQLAGLTSTSEGKDGEGKSGATMLSTPDKRYILKSMTNRDLDNLKTFVAKDDKTRVSNYMSRKNSALLVKFYAVVMVPIDGKVGRCKHADKHYCKTWLIMNNFIPIDFDIRMDLKGSELGRAAKAGEKLLKDNDVRNQNMRFLLSPKIHQDFLLNLALDKTALAASHLIDYSLIVGAQKFFLPVCKKPECQAPVAVHVRRPRTTFFVDAIRAHVNSTTAYQSDQTSDTWKQIQNVFCLPIWRPSLRRNDGCHAMVSGNVQTCPDGQPCAEVTVICYGIIDLLKYFGLAPGLEAAGRKVGQYVAHQGEASAVPPGSYATRFVNFLTERFQSERTMLKFEPDAAACSPWRWKMKIGWGK